MSNLLDEETSPPPTSPTRRKPLDYFSPSATRDRFWRLFDNRPKAKEFLKTLVIVIPVTLIIWIYAEQEQVVVQNVADVPVAIKIDPSLDFEMVGGPDQKVTLKLTGPQQALEGVRQQLTRNGGITIDLRSSMPVGNNEPVNIAERTQNMELFKSNGVTVMDSTPASLHVNIDQHLTKDLPVEVPPSVPNLTAETRFYPSDVIVSGPKPLFVSGLKVYADLAGKEELNKPGLHTIPGVHVTLSSPLERLKIAPQTVNADIVVRNADEDYTIDEIPISIGGPSLVVQNNNITLTGANTTNPTIVTGPPDQINKLKDGSFKPEAWLDVGPENIGASRSRKALRYKLPEGVTVKPESVQEVDFTVTPKAG